MAEITASLVKELREKTGVGMMDCKKALGETGGDVEAAVDWLRKEGMATAAKKAGRVAAEGLVGVVVSGAKGAMAEVNAETDFVALNEGFQEFVGNVAQAVHDGASGIDGLRAAEYPGGGTIADKLTEMISTIGENMDLRRGITLEVGDGVVSSYVHNQVGPGLGKIGVLVALESSGDTDALDAFGKSLAMHIAAAAPTALAADDLDPAEVDRERNVLTEQARASGKPEDIIEKMVEGRLRKFYQEVCLLEQIYVVDGENKVAKAVDAAAEELGSPIKVTGFARFALGEGIEKKEEDFASEVAATLGN